MCSEHSEQDTRNASTMEAWTALFQDLNKNVDEMEQVVPLMEKVDEK